MTGKKTSAFKQIVNQKGWTLGSVGQRWHISERQMSRVANSGNQRDIDAANGLPSLVNNGELPAPLTDTAESQARAVVSVEDAARSGDQVSEEPSRHALPEPLNVEGDYIPFVTDTFKNTSYELATKNRITPEDLLQRLIDSEV